MSRRGGEAELTASRDAPLGGQAVLEGVMMRGISTWAVAVRKPGAGAGAHGGPTLGPIDVQSFPLVSWTKRRRIYRWPVIRGVVALVESLAIGLRALGISANAQLAEAGTAAGGGGQEISSKAWAGTGVVAVGFPIGLFFV